MCIWFYDIDILSHAGVERVQQSMLHQLHPFFSSLMRVGVDGMWRGHPPPWVLSIQSFAAQRFKHPSLSASQAYHHGDPAHSGPNWSASLKTSNHLQSYRGGKQWWETLKHAHSASWPSLRSKQDGCIFGCDLLVMHSDMPRSFVCSSECCV